MPLYLADSSVWVGSHRPGAGYLKQLFVNRFRRGEIATCAPVALEVLDAAVDEETYARDWETVWRALFWLPVAERTMRRALEVQRALTRVNGHQSSSPIAFQIAACAELAGAEVVLWHWDPDLAAICRLTGQPQEWEQGRASEHGLRGIPFILPQASGAPP